MLHVSWKNWIVWGLFALLAATAGRADAFWDRQGCGCEGGGYHTAGALATGCGACTGSCETCTDCTVAPEYRAPPPPASQPRIPAPAAPLPAVRHSASAFSSAAFYRSIGSYSALNSPTGTVQFSIKVPSAAKVFVNGRLTDSSGEERRYFASDLQVGYDYDFRIFVEMRRDGKRFSAVKTVRVQAGQTHQLSFTLPNGHGDRQLDRVARNMVKPAALGN